MWKYQDRPVVVMPTANVPSVLFGPRYNEIVQRALQVIPPWEGTVTKQKVTISLEGVNLLPDTVHVPREGRVIWGIHKRHQARQPGLSPFYRPEGDLPLTDLLTITYGGTVRRLKIYSAYAGPARPSLPWMVTARDEPAGRPEAYWNFHAFLLVDSRMIRPGSVSEEPPSWYVRSMDDTVTYS